jgi:hypothetical protein
VLAQLQQQIASQNTSTQSSTPVVTPSVTSPTATTPTYTPTPITTPVVTPAPSTAAATITTPATLPAVSLSLSPTTVQVGSRLHITWSSTGAASCDLVHDAKFDTCTNGPGTCALSNSTSWITTEVGNHSSTLTCTSPYGQSASQTQYYTVTN